MSHVNIKDFGAVGDGITDDTQAIQNACDSLNTQNQFNKGGYLVFDPSKIYKITRPLVISRRISLQGQGATLMAEDCDAIKLLPNTLENGIRDTNFTFTTIQDLTILNNSLEFNNYSCAKNKRYTGIHCVDQAFVKVVNCHVLYFNKAIFFDGCQQIFVKENKIERCWVGVKSYGTESAPNPTGPITQTDGIAISDNILDQCAYPIYVNAFGANQGPTRIQSNYIFAPTQDMADQGFYMRVGVIAEACKGLLITGTILDAYTVYRGYIRDKSYNTFVKNTVGIMIDGHTADAYLRDENILIDFPKPEPNFSYSDGVVLQANQLRTVGYGLVIKNATGIDISSNNFQDITEVCIKSYNTFNSGKIQSNSYPAIELTTTPLYDIPIGARLLVDEVQVNTDIIRRDRSIVTKVQYDVISGFDNQGGNGDIYLPFGDTLPNIPEVYIQPEGNYGNTCIYVAQPYNVTKTGCMVKRKIIDSTSGVSMYDGGFGFYWEAKARSSFT